MRTTIRLNAELARRAKQYAAEKQTTFTHVVEEAITRLLAGGAAGQLRPKRKIRLPIAGNRKRRMTENQYRAVVERMYEQEAESLVPPPQQRGRRR
jgi:hypothetical protein